MIAVACNILHKSPLNNCYIIHLLPTQLIITNFKLNIKIINSQVICQLLQKNVTDRNTKVILTVVFQRAEPFWQWLNRTTQWNKPDVGWVAAGIHLSPPNFVIFHRPVHALVCQRSGSIFDTIWAQFFSTSFLWIFNRLTGQSSAHTPRISARGTPLTPPIARSKQRQPPLVIQKLSLPILCRYGQYTALHFLAGVFYWDWQAISL